MYGYGPPGISGPRTATAITFTASDGEPQPVAAKFKELPSIFDFISDTSKATIEAGTNENDLATEIQAALATGRYVHANKGTFHFGSTLTVPDGGGLIGSEKGSILVPEDMAASPAIQLNANKTASGGNPATRAYAQLVSRLRIEGTALCALDTRGAQHAAIDAVHAVGTFTDGFQMGYNWGSDFRRLRTEGATISNAAFNIGDGFNANNCAAWYSGQTYMPFGIIMDASIGSGGNAFNGIALQGHTDTALWIKHNCYGIAFNGLYIENCVLPVRLGDRANSKICRNICFNAAKMGGPTVANAGYANRHTTILLDYCAGIVFNSPEFVSVDTSTPPIIYAITVNRCLDCAVVGSYAWAGGLAASKGLYDYIKHTATSFSDAGVTIIGGGRSTQNAAQIYMKSEGNAWKHFLKGLDSAGAWTTLEKTPGYGVSPPTLLASPVTQHANTTAYALDAYVYVSTAAVGSNVYKCVTAGTSGTGTAPTGTSNGQTDGTVTWDFHGTLV